MSSTNRGKGRVLDDYYATPPDLAQLICEQLREDFLPAPTSILEPGCGEGFFLDAFRNVWPFSKRVGVELNPELVELAAAKGHSVVARDVLEDGSVPTGWDAIIGNPPFKHADEFIRLLTPKLSSGGVLAFLLRLNFLGGQARFRSLWSQGERLPTHIYVLPARPGFTPDGRTDSIEYMVAVWTAEDRDGATTIGHLDNTHLENKWKGEAVQERQHGYS